MPAGFRPFSAAALDLLLSFMSRLYAYDAIPFDPARARRTAEWLAANPAHGEIRIIEVEEEPAGYLVLTACVSLEFGGPFALLDELYIDDPWRRRGIGAQALEFAVAWARDRGFNALRLETGHDNLPAQNLYRKAGFILHDRHLMTRWL